MIHPYTKKLEALVAEMNIALQGDEVLISDTEYNQWLGFLKQVYPESELVAANTPQQTSVDALKESLAYNLKIYDDIHDIMMLAEIQKYPTWFVQPHLTGLTIILNYQFGKLISIAVEDNGRLESLELRTLDCIPQEATGLTGSVKGVLYLSKAEYIKCGATDSETAQVAVYEAYANNQALLAFRAFDIDSSAGFLDKMHLLDQYGFTPAEYVLFPTSRLSTISSSKLETFFKSFIAKTYAEGYLIDGLMIISDTGLIVPEESVSSTRVLYKSSLEPPA